MNESSPEQNRELEQTNALLSTLFDTLPRGVLVENESRNVLTVNQRMFDLFALPGSSEDVVGEDCERLAREVSEMFVEPQQFVDRINELVAEREPIDGEELELADGRTFERTYRPLELPDGTGHLWFYEDVTERIEHEQRLEALNQASRKLLSVDTREEAAEVGVEVARDVLDLDANAIHFYDDDRSALVPVAATDAVYEVVGEPPTFTAGDSIAWHTCQRGEALALDNVQNNPDVYNSDTPIQSELLIPIADDGILIAGSPTPAVFDDQDVLLGEILAGNIATALDQIEQTQRLRTRERELTRQNERLEQFASIVSHDLRNPLNVAEMRVELLQREYDSDHFAPLERAHDRMEALIDDLLALARHGETVTERESVRLSTLAERCWENVETGAATTVTNTERTIEADRGRLKQLFENLFRNAVEHAGESATVTVGSLDDGFFVEDDGPGIPAERRDDIFEAGYSTSDAGTGFGLSIVEQVVEAHDWDIRVTESADGGARFEITGVESTSE